MQGGDRQENEVFGVQPETAGCPLTVTLLFFLTDTTPVCLRATISQLKSLMLTPNSQSCNTARGPETGHQRGSPWTPHHPAPQPSWGDYAGTSGAIAHSEDTQGEQRRMPVARHLHRSPDSLGSKLGLLTPVGQAPLTLRNAILSVQAAVWGDKAAGRPPENQVPSLFATGQLQGVQGPSLSEPPSAISNEGGTPRMPASQE